MMMYALKIIATKFLIVFCVLHFSKNVLFGHLLIYNEFGHLKNNVVNRNTENVKRFTFDDHKRMIETDDYRESLITNYKMPLIYPWKNISFNSTVTPSDETYRTYDSDVDNKCSLKDFKPRKLRHLLAQLQRRTERPLEMKFENNQLSMIVHGDVMLGVILSVNEQSNISQCGHRLHYIVFIITIKVTIMNVVFVIDRN